MREGTASRTPRLIVGPTAYLCILFIYFSVPAGSALRDVLYILPLLFFAELLIRGKLILRPATLTVGVLTLSYLGFSASQRADDFALRESLFVLSSIAVAIPKYHVSVNFPRYLVLVAGAVALLVFFSGIATNGASDISELTRGLAESELGLIVPIATIIFYLRRDWRWMAISILVDYAMYKRIALIAIVLVLCVDLALRFTHRSIHDPIRRLLAITLVAASCIVSLNSIAFFEMTSGVYSNLAGYVVGPNELTSGRYYATVIFWREVLEGADPMELIFGRGIGASTHAFAVLGNLRLENFMLPHNDWLRVFADLGLIGIAAAVAGYLWAMARGRLLLLVSVYSLILFMTDNIATYFIYWAGAVLLIRSVYYPDARSRRLAHPAALTEEQVRLWVSPDHSARR